MNRATDFTRGVLFWLNGWRHLFSKRRLLLLAVVPFLFAITSAATMITLLWLYLPAWLQLLLHAVFGLSTGLWHDLMYYPMLVSVALLLMVACLYFMYVLQSLIAIPFYSLLAERTLAGLGARSPRTGWGHALHMFRAGLVKSVLLLSLGVFLFLFSFVPILNFVAIAGALLLLALDSMDYTFEALGWGLGRRAKYLRREWAQWLGMGTGLALTLLVPGLTLLVIPGAVVGSALIVKLENQTAELEPQKKTREIE